MLDKHSQYNEPSYECYQLSGYSCTNKPSCDQNMEMMRRSVAMTLTIRLCQIRKMNFAVLKGNQNRPKNALEKFQVRAFNVS